MNGMELAQKLRSIGWKTILIFITAYADYVFDAFDVGAFHYLAKPISDKKFEEVLHKAAEQFDKQKTNVKNTDIVRNDEKWIMVKRGGVHITIKVSDIIYAEIFNRKVVLYTTVESIEYYRKLKSLEDEVGSNFYRPHRAYLVNLKYVLKYNNNAIFIQNSQVMMAKQNYAGFIKAYMTYMKREYGKMSEHGRSDG